MKENNPLEELLDGLKYIWVHRKGHEAYAGVYDAIEALYTKNLKPIIIRKINLSESKVTKDADKRGRKPKKNKKPQKLSNGWEFHINLPPGLSYAEFKKKEQIFADAVGGTVQIEKKGKLVTMVVSTSEIKKSYPYSFDPNKFDGFLPVHFGFSSIGEIIKDLSSMPNLIIAGHPGAGKSNFIHGLILALLLNKKYPSWIIVFDFKRLDYSYLKDHVLLVTEIEFARTVFLAINHELNKRLDILERAGVVKMQDYLDQGGDMPFLVVIVDELAEMQDEECQTSLNRILRLGRAAGICCVCATQRPSSTMFKAFGDSKAMFSGTMCFHVRDEVNSRMLLDNERAALIPNIPGRAIYQWDNELEVQTMNLPVKTARKMLREIHYQEVRFGERVKPPKKLLPR